MSTQGKSDDGPAAGASDLPSLRGEIDGIDDQILGLLDRRAEVVKRVGELKRQRAETFHVPGRERAVLERLTAAARGAFPRQAVRPVFREIMSACLSLESPLVVAYPGPEATFSHLAGKTRFGLSARYAPAASIGEVFREVGRGADYGVVPVEEASEGLVTHALDHFLDSDLLIVGEIIIEAAHALLTHTGSTAGIERVYAHPVAAARCAAGLVESLPRASVVAAPSAAAAAALARDDARAAAVAPALAAEIFDLTVAKVRLDDGPADVARFLVLGKTAPPASGTDATSLLLGLDDQPGRLARVLDRLAAGGVNLRRIASRPTDRRQLRDLFFVDLDGHRSDPVCQAALEGLASELPLLKVLGSYPRDVAGGRRV
ncbi:MAG TPA: prephenate dehydratase domain-containing protein [Polyangia bacterium]|jgi:chorismate mutase/prephenate dehydratase|nr:prephenate dehydratase domain-containing protein [Polyangia bacterium]